MPNCGRTIWPERAQSLLRWSGPCAGGDKLKVLACGAEAVDSARQTIGALAEIIPASFGDIWLRDTGPIFATTAAGTVALRFRQQRLGRQVRICPAMTRSATGWPRPRVSRSRAFDAVLEGGALEHNGAGTILTTRQCLLNPNRNAGWTQARAEALLRKAFNCRRVLWLDDGLMNDHTDGHIDNLARFIAADVVVCQARER